MINNCRRFALSLLLGGCLFACQRITDAITPGAALKSSSAAVPGALSSAPDSVQQLAPFIPAGYQLLATANGDLNRDDLPDKVMVLQAIGADTATTDPGPSRPLLLLLGQPGRRFQLAARNDHVVMCASCGGMMGDPFQRVVIKNGFFSVEHFGGSAWRWTSISTFKYDPADKTWYLHREGGESFHASEPDKVITHMKTARDFGRILFERYDSEARYGK